MTLRRRLDQRRGPARLLIHIAVEAAEEAVLVQAEDDVRRAHVAAAAQWMLIGDGAPAALHRGLERLRQLHQQPHAVLVAGDAAGEDERALRGHEHLCRFGHSSGIARRRRREGQLRNAELRAVGDRVLLQRRVHDQHHRAARLGHRELVGPHRRLGEVLQRAGRVVPLQHVADHVRGVLHRVRAPVERRPPRFTVEDVGAQEIGGRAARERAEDPHHGVLQARWRERDHRHRLAGHRVVAVGDVHRRLFVRARQPLGRFVAAVVDEGFVETAEARARVGDDVLEVQRLQHVHHEVGARVRDDERIGFLSSGAVSAARRWDACSGESGAAAGDSGGVAPAPATAAGTARAAAPAAPAPFRNPRLSTFDFDGLATACSPRKFRCGGVYALSATTTGPLCGWLREFLLVLPGQARSAQERLQTSRRAASRRPLLVSQRHQRVHGRGAACGHV